MCRYIVVRPRTLTPCPLSFYLAFNPFGKVMLFCGLGRSVYRTIILLSLECIGRFGMEDGLSR